ncbi:hypothetical protein Dform_02047 [Dehalogenimonas formicexedens]|uniref:Uncharacterized protein n=1 Tax=Dehalogenimonas formicexedens TaxID=1839801 RepID=A0A1P8FA63_9CHLR|nr:hypothetical protein [Dehalogenimonas formicexedens]APV45356.1 hypothetical protein Dform_02047 [Dehalogenimonas formicexedens]
MKKLIAIVSLVLTVGIFAGVAVPLYAADPGGTAPATAQNIGKFGRAAMLARLLLVQDQAKVDQLLANAVANGKLTGDQAARIDDFWADHHAQFTKRVVLRNLLRVQDEGRLNEILSQAVTNGRITQEQADRITAAWEKIHNK